MIEYKVITKQDAIDWQKRNPQKNRLSDFKLEHKACMGFDEPIAIVAIDEDRIVGRIFLFTGYMTIDGENILCRCSGDLFVHPMYRHRGVGLFIKMHMLKLGEPQLVGGVSGDMQKIYQKWNQFQPVDNSPICTLPLCWDAIVFFGRLAYYKRIGNGAKESKLIQLYYLMRYLVASRMAVRVFNRDDSILSSKEAVAALDGILNNNLFRVQIPWNINKLIEGLNAKRKDFFCWVVNCKAGNVRAKYLVTVYVKHKSVRTVHGKTVKIKEAHLNEIFPPTYNIKQLKSILSLVLKKILTLGFQALQLYATTDPLIKYCKSLNMISFYSKTVSIAVNGLETDLANIALEPRQWWCRAISEEQFREASCLD